MDKVLEIIGFLIVTVSWTNLPALALIGEVHQIQHEMGKIVLSLSDVSIEMTNSEVGQSYYIFLYDVSF